MACDAPHRRATRVLAESLGKPSLWVIISAPWYYSLDNVPPGTYTLKAWHPRFGIKKTKITVEAGGTVAADFAFSAG